MQGMGITLDHPVVQVQSNQVGKVTEGGRNNHLTSLAGSMRRRGMNEPAILAALLAENLEFDIPLAKAEVIKIAHSISKYPPDGKQTSNFNLTDLGNAKRLVNEFGERIRYCHETKKWLVWNDQRWIIDNNGMIDRMAKQTASAIYKEIQDEDTPERRSAIARHAANSENVNRLAAMIKLARTESGIPISLSNLDSDNYLLAVNNGVINLKTGQLITPQQDQYITKQAHVDFQLNAECRVWQEFLNKTFNGDTELISYIQRALGYSLTGDNKEQVLFFPYGNGANGKSTFINAANEIMGDYAQGCSSDTFTAKQAGAATNDIAKLRGSRLVIAPETEEGRRMAETTIKQLTGGDTISARFLYGEFFEFIPTFKIWIVGNHKPVIRGSDYGIWRRIMLIPFNQTIPEGERDSRLSEKLRNEYPGILNWMIEGCLQWQREGLKPPFAVTDATKEYQTEMDVIGNWMNDQCDLGNMNFIESAYNLYNSFKAWAENNNEYVLTQTTFGIKLKEKGLTKTRNVGVIYTGIRLKPTGNTSM